jgi:hypothetical protein
MKRYTPTTIPNSARQRVLSSDGIEFQRRYVYLPKEAWELLGKLSQNSLRSTSQVIQDLVSIAAQAGSLTKDTHNDKSNAHTSSQ